MAQRSIVARWRLQIRWQGQCHPKLQCMTLVWTSTAVQVWFVLKAATASTLTGRQVLSDELINGYSKCRQQDKEVHRLLQQMRVHAHL